MFTIPWEGKVSLIKAIGKAGDNKLQMTIVAAAEDAMLQIDTVGNDIRKAYELVRSGKTGTIPCKMPPRMMCKMRLDYDTGGKRKTVTLAHVIPERLAIVATDKDDQPPKVRMIVCVEYTDKEAVHVLHSLRRDVTVDIGPADGKGLPFNTEKVKSPRRRSGNGKPEAQEATA